MRGRRRWRRASAAVAIAALALVLASCREGRPGPVGQLAVSGGAEIASEGEDFRPVEGDSALVRPGEIVRVVSGEAALGLGGERSLELRQGTTVRLLAASAPHEAQAELMAGDLLVVAPAEAARLTAGGSDVVVEGAARLSRGLAVVVSTYTGTADVQSSGRRIAVDALRQASIAAPGLVPARPSPITFEPGDEWDERYLGEAIALGNELVERSLALTRELGPGEGRTPGFYRLLVPALEDEPAFGAGLLDPARAPGETLVGAAIVVEGTRGDFAERWRQVFRFHDEGAAWGIVALDQGVVSAGLVERVDAALARTPGFAAGPPPDGAGGGGAGGGGAGAGGPGAGGVGAGGAGGSTVTPGSPGTGGGSGGTGTGGGSGGTGRLSPGTGSEPPSGGPPASPAPGSGSQPSHPEDPLERTTSSRTGVPLVDDTLDIVVDTLGGLLRGLSLG